MYCALGCFKKKFMNFIILKLFFIAIWKIFYFFFILWSYYIKNKSMYFQLYNLFITSNKLLFDMIIYCLNLIKMIGFLIYIIIKYYYYISITVIFITYLLYLLYLFWIILLLETNFQLFSQINFSIYYSMIKQK